MELFKSRPSIRPWEMHPALTAQRLIAVGGIIRQTRDGAARGAKRSIGDDAWVIGCTAYKRATTALQKAAAGEYQEWLKAEPIAGHFLIRLCGIPIRHYSGDQELRVPEKYCTASSGEDEALQLALGDYRLPIPGSHLRLEVSTTSKSFTDQITFVVVDEMGGRHHPWPIPLFGARRAPQPGSVVLPKPGGRAQRLRLVSDERSPR